MTPEGVSRRAYAKSRGVSEAAIRGHIERGTLADAVLPNGLLDPVKADQLLAEASPQTQRETSPTVKAARRRRLIAQVHVILDQVKELRATSVHADDIEPVLINPDREIIATALRKAPPLVGPAVAGKEIREAAQLIDDIVNAALTEASTTPSPDREGGRVAPDPDPGTMTTAALTATKADLQAVKMEIERAYAHGVLVDVHDVLDDWSERMAVSKSIFVGLTGRIAPLAAQASPEELTALAAAEVERAIAALSPPTEGDHRAY